MNNSGGALLTEVYGSESIKVNKKHKKKKEQGYIPSSKEHIYPQKLEKIDSFDENFHGNSNIMPYGGFSSEGGYFPINKEDNIGDGSKYFPYEKYTLEGHRKPVPPTVKDSHVPERLKDNEEPCLDCEKSPIPSDKEQHNIPPTQPGVVAPKVYENPPKQWVWDKGMKITHEEYKEFLEFKEFKSKQQNEIIQRQRSKSQEEGFSNINDDFNDVLLFGLLGIFFLIFTDYVYKLGRKSY